VLVNKGGSDAFSVLRSPFALIAGVTLMPCVALAQREGELPPHNLDTPREMRVPGRIFVQLTPEAQQSGEGEQFITAMTRMFEGRVLRRYKRLLPGMVLLQVRPGDERVVADIACMSGEVQSIAWDTWGGTNAGPNDPRAVNGEMDVWRERVCIDPVWDAGITSSASVIAAVIDTGVNYLQRDLVPNMWVNTAELSGAQFLDDDGNGVADDIHGAAFIWPDPITPPLCVPLPATCSSGYECDYGCEYYIDGAQLANGISEDPFDRDAAYWGNFTGPCFCPDKGAGWVGHGTQTAALVGAAGNNNLQATGASWSAKIMAVRVFDTPWRIAFASDFVAGLEYAAASGARVAAIPLTYEYSSALEAAVWAACEQQGMTLVCAAGNGGVNVPWPPPNGRRFPAAFANIDGVISVGASDHVDKRLAISNWGAQTVDVFAPGFPMPVLDTFYSDTSGASSLVAGIVALYVAQNPGISPSQVEADVVNTATLRCELIGLCRSGGVLNARRLFNVPGDCLPDDTCP
jgi:subtilisin family serine protease